MKPWIYCWDFQVLSHPTEELLQQLLIQREICHCEDFCGTEIWRGWGWKRSLGVAQSCAQLGFGHNPHIFPGLTNLSWGPSVTYSSSPAVSECLAVGERRGPGMCFTPKNTFWGGGWRSEWVMWTDVKMGITGSHMDKVGNWICIESLKICAEFYTNFFSITPIVVHL